MQTIITGLAVTIINWALFAYLIETGLMTCYR